ncbi:MAG TPA: AmmeMemoRadiSam system protein A [Candidatus Krumholzibacteria bacterium]|nr:AmmeMemoRadiSam system protein A [Candidatus Krumholzibacteria bacterium]
MSGLPDRRERAFLRDLARLAVEAAARGAPPPEPAAEAEARGLALEGVLAEPCGVFVTLTRGGALRGCIGTIVGVRPLAEAVVWSGRAAACEDPRFPPVGPGELASLELEISVLSPLATVADADAIEVGRHGVLLQKGSRQAVFLPQVAPEQGWDRETMLAHLCLKAGLPPDAWQEGTVFKVFTALVF